MQDMSGLSFNPINVDFCSGCLHGSVHGRHVFLLAAAGVIRPQDVSAHCFALDFLLKHGHPMLALAEQQIRCWHQWLWSAYVADPYAAHLGLVGASANVVSCISIEPCPRVLCVVSDSSLTLVGGSKRNNNYHRITGDIMSCKHQLGVDWVYAKDLWGKPLAVLVDAVEALVQQAQTDCSGAEIDVCLAWGANEATGGSTQIVDPALGDPNQLLQCKTVKLAWID